jgi:Spy/CpxP family protein refolding chaperone
LIGAGKRDMAAAEFGLGGGETMRPLIAGLTLLAAVAVMTTAAQAQTTNPQASQMTNASHVGQHAGNANAQGADESKVKANDKAYNAALKNLPDKQYDPWRGVR